MKLFKINDKKLNKRIYKEESQLIIYDIYKLSICYISSINKYGIYVTQFKGIMYSGGIIRCGLDILLIILLINNYEYKFKDAKTINWYIKTYCI